MKLDKTTKHRIKKFKEYLDSASESFNNVLEIDFSEKTKNAWIGTFEISDKKYNISIINVVTDDIPKEDNVYITKFGVVDGDNVTYKKLKDNDTFRSLSAFATMNSCVKSFIKENSPNVMTFTSSDLNPTRIKLYQKFCSDICDEIGGYFDLYHVYNQIPIFILCKFNYNIMIIKDFYIKIYDYYYNQNSTL